MVAGLPERRPNRRKRGLPRGSLRDGEKLASDYPGLDDVGACSRIIRLGTDRGRETPAGTSDGAGGNTGPVLHLGTADARCGPGSAVAQAIHPLSTPYPFAMPVLRRKPERCVAQCVISGRRSGLRRSTRLRMRRLSRIAPHPSPAILGPIVAREAGCVRL